MNGCIRDKILDGLSIATRGIKEVLVTKNHENIGRRGKDHLLLKDVQWQEVLMKELGRRQVLLTFSEHHLRDGASLGELSPYVRFYLILGFIILLDELKFVTRGYR